MLDGHWRACLAVVLLVAMVVAMVVVVVVGTPMRGR
jgi:hypothetical protein